MTIRAGGSKAENRLGRRTALFPYSTNNEVRPTPCALALLSNLELTLRRCRRLAKVRPANEG